MKSILFVQPNLVGIGGVEKVIPILAESLSRTGNEVSQFTFYGEPEIIPIWWRAALVLGEEKSLGKLDKIHKVWQRATALIKFIKKVNPQIIIVSTQGASIIVLALKAFRLVRVPVVVYVHQALSASDCGYLPLARLFYKSADAFVCVSKGVAGEVSEAFPRAVVTVVYNPVVIQNNVKAISHHDEGPIFVTASRLETIRGADVLVSIMTDYLTIHQGTLWLLGDGALRQTLEQQVVERKLEKRIRFFGAVSNVADYLQVANLYIALPRAEAFGVALVEAIAAGLPIVVTDAPYGPREIFGLENQSMPLPIINPLGALLPAVDSLPTLLPVVSTVLDAWQQGQWTVDSEKQKEKIDSYSVKNATKRLQAVIDSLI
ncbi:hypothetical protein COU87_01090 [Candidatus Roizmanbacteria bacterium CG10_big_fil_rev_8_21_14_0_10_39_12]|uniref:Glycosyltransferase subfamily 4-like N-terminal domain-containing protein n=1 Tax=Candidatus Roizmanbacteria bacterium CG10_big_fil_rev_8_21_14_0_10_39_12 TaxID=1974852 RepID=A0A2M8KQA1_9BACT|nr:MAG: hypothetical protein COY15_00160 [Candidatus Roizmanbacteria bacterium CG_4_10_14_0_2_um_filter_39_12]PJE62106.1 MAG: hypothetical protein COU87_01090 [Candidatus Roizmanbacteria bacterium CG10_big_fil_rev_8_21_14_0_10_39_12]